MIRRRISEREELQKLEKNGASKFQYSSNITQSRKVLWTSHVAHKGDIVENIKKCKKNCWMFWA